jgi:hypothetical protein
MHTKEVNFSSSVILERLFHDLELEVAIPLDLLFSPLDKSCLLSSKLILIFVRGYFEILINTLGEWIGTLKNFVGLVIYI